MGLTWEHIHKLNPRMIVASVKGFGPGPYEDCKVYENVAQCAGGAASTTGFREGPPLVTGAQIGDSGTGLHLALGIVCALYQRNRTGRGQKVLAAMQDGVPISAASSCATSSGSRPVRSPNTVSTARVCRSAMLCRARAMIPAAASPAGS
jgi:crotonobetainyl-CoA:carnitine CoA-transferase CaiB-like acyl-CoA transferase